MLNVITIVVTTVICNIYFRSAATHHLPPWVRSLFLEVCLVNSSIYLKTLVASPVHVHEAAESKERASILEETAYSDRN